METLSQWGVLPRSNGLATPLGEVEGFPGGSDGKESTCNLGDPSRSSAGEYQADEQAGVAGLS